MLNNGVVVLADENRCEQTQKAASARKLWFDRASIITAVTAWVNANGLTVLDPSLISGSNFVISILLARWLTPTMYGAYAVAFAIFTLLMLIYSSLMSEPMALFGSSLYRDNLRSYVRSLLSIQLPLSLAMFFVLAAAAAVIRVTSMGAGLSGALTGLAIAAPCVQLLWLARSFYRRTPRFAVRGGFAYLSLVLAALYVVKRYGSLSPFSAFLLMGLGASGTAVIMFRKIFASVPTTGPKLRARAVWSRALDLWQVGIDSLRRELDSYVYILSVSQQCPRHRTCRRTERTDEYRPPIGYDEGLSLRAVSFLHCGITGTGRSVQCSGLMGKNNANSGRSDDTLLGHSYSLRRRRIPLLVFRPLRRSGLSIANNCIGFCLLGRHIWFCDCFTGAGFKVIAVFGLGRRISVPIRRSTSHFGLWSNGGYLGQRSR